MLLVGLVNILQLGVFGLIGLLPSWTAPAAVQSGGTIQTGMTTFGGYAQYLSAWVDFTQVSACFTVVVGAVAVASVIWIIRKTINFIPFVKA